MLDRRMLFFPLLAALILLTACTALRSLDGTSPEEIKKSESSKDELWDLAKTLEKEKTICQQQLADQAGVVNRMNASLSDQRDDISRSNRQISELRGTIDDLSIKLKQLQEVGKRRTSDDTIHGEVSEAWGTIVYAKDKTNIRAKRSLDSRSRGFLMPGQTVKADFLKDNWYAVFKITEADKLEKNALGYVYAPRLFMTFPPQKTPGAGMKAAPSEDNTAKEIFSVAVKSIRHKVRPGGKEALLVDFDRFYVPAVYSVEGETPMIILDVTCTGSINQEWSEIKTDGTLIQKIRVSLNTAAGILRILMHMAPDKHYDISPTFYTGKESNVYSLEVAGVTPKK